MKGLFVKNIFQVQEIIEPIPLCIAKLRQTDFSL